MSAFSLSWTVTMATKCLQCCLHSLIHLCSWINCELLFLQSAWCRYMDQYVLLSGWSRTADLWMWSHSINDWKMLSSIHHTHTHHIRWSVILSVSAVFSHLCEHGFSVENHVKQKCMWSYWTSIIHLVTQSFNLNVDCYERFPSLRTQVSK